VVGWDPVTTLENVPSRVPDGALWIALHAPGARWAASMRYTIDPVDTGDFPSAESSMAAREISGLALAAPVENVSFSVVS
jgi:hypothetical protein